VKSERKTRKTSSSPTEKNAEQNLNALKALFTHLQQQYQLSPQQLVDVLQKQDIFIPISVFNKELSGLEVIVKFLKENHNLENTKIAKLLQRSEKTIWQAYNDSKTKYSKKILPEQTPFVLPVEIFASRKLSVLETIVSYLKENYKLTNHQIAELLKRDDRTIWTVHSRAQKKKEEHGK